MLQNQFSGKAGDSKRRHERPRTSLAVESLEDRHLLSHISVGMNHGHAHQPAEVQQLGDNGVIRKAPHYYELFHAIGQRPDLLVIKASARLVPGRGLVFRGMMQAKINVHPASDSENSVFVFGVNRGSPNAIAPFPMRSGIIFDSLVAVSITHATGISAFVVDIAGGGTFTPLSADSVKIEGKQVRVTVDPSLLPTPAGSTETLSQYRFNLWPRDALGLPSTIASFIPENSMAPIFVPSGHDH